ncbi:hypothetical protein SNEBB_002950 [Seison nebaliae]|nr:hypothetical protein SNEBB_002950 [Seison nebaliae]
MEDICSTLTCVVIEIKAAYKDIKLPENVSGEFVREKHLNFLLGFGSEHSIFDCRITEYLRLNGFYWTLTCAELLNCDKNIERKKIEGDDLLRIPLESDEIIKLVNECRNEDGGYGAAPNNDSHLLTTLSAVQIAVTYGKLDDLDIDAIGNYVKARENEDGSFSGDKWNEIDTRFSFCAVAIMKLINRLDRLNIENIVNFIRKCRNIDGGFGTCPGAETHSGQIYCCCGILGILNRIDDVIDRDKLGHWLIERQLPSGGLNGRPEKMPDVCYSWWVLASLAIIERLHWINRDGVKTFILAAQNEEEGGIGDRPNHMCDPFHTLFGVAGLSLMGYYGNMIKKVNPIYCMSSDTIDEHLKRF